MIHAYKLAGYNIVLDVASGAVHCVDGAAYDAIVSYEHESRENAVKHVLESHPDVTHEEAIELMSEIDELIEQGKLFSADDYAIIADSLPDLPLKALCLNVSHLCNMTCSYCFAARGMDSGGSGNGRDGGLMSPDVAKLAVDFLIKNSGARDCLDIDFFGGEPLLNWETVKETVTYARSMGRERGKTFRFTLTTNGLLIDDDVIDFTSREMHNIVLSLDGRPHINDAARKLHDGSGSYGSVIGNIKKTVEARGGKGYYIRGTYTRDNLDFVNDILHLADLGFTQLSMEPAVSKPGDSFGLKPGDLPVLFGQYELLAAEMLAREKQGRGFAFYHFTLDLARGPCVYKRVAGCGVGTEYLAVTPDGRLYPCHQFAGDERFLMGDVRSGVTNSKLRGEFAGCSIYSRDECKECWARFHCSGGCAANAYNAAGSIGSVSKLDCELFKKRLECAIMLRITKRT